MGRGDFYRGGTEGTEKRDKGTLGVGMKILNCRFEVWVILPLAARAFAVKNAFKREGAKSAKKNIHPVRRCSPGPPSS